MKKRMKMGLPVLAALVMTGCLTGCASSNPNDIQNMATDMVNAVSAFGGLITLLGLAFALIIYFVEGYAIMCTGHKAKIEGDFMPFVPIARQIYQMKIADCPVWYIFFFGTSTITVCSVMLICFLLWMVIESIPIITALIIIYVLANMVFTFLYYQKYYKAFGFNPNTAWLNIIPSFGVVALVFGMLIAFSNDIHYGDYVDPSKLPGVPGSGEKKSSNKGVIVGVSGKYENASFDMEDGAELVFGRSPQEANIVFDQVHADVSRKHCSVRFDGRNNQYIVTDFSATGTYTDGGVRLEKNQPKQLSRGTVIYLGGSKQNVFRLN